MADSVDEEQETLTERLRATTSAIHDKSDRLVNVKLALVLVSRQLYGEALELFAPIYQNLERAMEHHTTLRPMALLLDKTRRFPRFQADIAFYLGKEEKQQEKGPNEVLKTYMDHLNELEREDPQLLAVYIYHMYMAILAGGYIIRKTVKRTLGLKSDEGVQALTFSSDVDCRQLRKSLKSCMNEELKFSKHQQERVLEESVRLFELNNALVGTVKETLSFKQVQAKYIRWMQGLSVVLVATFAAYCIRNK